MKTVRLLVVFFAFVLISGTAFAAEKDGVSLPNSVSVGGTPLVLNGMGTREATFMNIDVYVAGLYLQEKSSDGSKIAASTTKRRLVLRFVRDVGRGDIVKAWTEGFEKNGLGNKAALNDRIKRLSDWMADMKKGQHLTFTYESGKGVAVDVNGTVKGTVSGDDFARAFFLIWLGPNPPNAGLKSGLLGK